MPDPQKPFVHPLFAPVVQGYPTIPGAGNVSHPIYDRAPRAQEVRWAAADQAADTGGGIKLSVDKPTLVKVLGIADPVAGDQINLDLFWKAFGEPGVPAGSFYSSMPAFEFYRNSFAGPYAYFPRAGEYEIFAITGVAAGSNKIMRAQILQDFSPEEWQLLLTSNGCRAVESFGGTLVAGVLTNTPPQYSAAFPQFRSMIVDNTGATNSLSIRLGTSASGQITVAAGASFEIAEAYLGRTNVSLFSTAGTTFRVLVGLW